MVGVVSVNGSATEDIPGFNSNNNEASCIMRRLLLSTINGMWRIGDYLVHGPAWGEGGGLTASGIGIRCAASTEYFV